MQASDPLSFALVFSAAVLFSVLTLADRSDYQDPDWPTYFALIIRRPIFAFAAFYFWLVEGGMGYALSDVSVKEVAVTYVGNVTTIISQGPAAPNAYGQVFGLLGTIFAAVFFVLIWFFAFLVAYTIARQGYIGRRGKEASPTPRDAV